MTTITYVAFTGETQDVEADEGATVMETAVFNGVEGIVAECGGACSCATCHVYVDERWIAKVGRAEGTERDMLSLASDVEPNSRLSCQIVITAELDGLLVRTPERQG